MAKLDYTFLVTIVIDTEQTMPCECGHRRNTFPDWPWKYKDCEREFINETWRDFRSRFRYDGLGCQILTVENSEFKYLSEPTNNDKLDDARRLIEEVMKTFIRKSTSRLARLKRNGFKSATARSLN
jgi:hypothetical protein